LVLLSEFEGLKASAVAVALTVLPVLPQMREKNVGRLALVTFAVTMGLTAKAAGKPEQSDVGPLPPAEYVTVTVAAIPPTEFCIPTA
jgi:hypothetical protein